MQIGLRRRNGQKTRATATLHLYKTTLIKTKPASPLAKLKTAFSTKTKIPRATTTTTRGKLTLTKTIKPSAPPPTAPVRLIQSLHLPVLENKKRHKLISR